MLSPCHCLSSMLSQCYRHHKIMGAIDPMCINSFRICLLGPNKAPRTDKVLKTQYKYQTSGLIRIRLSDGITTYQTRVVISNTPNAISAEMRAMISHSSRTDLLFCMISRKYFRLSCTNSSCRQTAVCYWTDICSTASENECTYPARQTLSTAQHTALPWFAQC